MSEAVPSPDYTLLHQTIEKTGVVPIKPPANLQALHGAEGIVRGIFAVLPAALPIAFAPALMGACAWAFINNPAQITNLKSLKGSLTHVDFAERKDATAGHNLKLRITALRRSDGAIDLLVRAHVGYITAFFQGDDFPAELRSQFRDMAAFRLGAAAAEGADVVLAADSLVPATTINTVTYSYSNSWTLEAGFGGGVEEKGPKAEGSIKGGFSFSVNTSRSQSDFDVARRTIGDGLVAGWESSLLNLAAGAQAGQVYSTTDLSKIIGHSWFTNWIHDVPVSAKNDLDLEYMAAYTLRGPLPKKIVIPFEAAQRLIHAEVCGRFGAPGARVGGLPVILPTRVQTTGDIVVDTETWTASLENFGTRYLDTKAFIDEVLEKVEKKTKEETVPA